MECEMDTDYTAKELEYLNSLRTCTRITKFKSFQIINVIKLILKYVLYTFKFNVC